MTKSVFSSFAVQGRVAFLISITALPVASAMFRVWVYQDTVRLGYALAAQQQKREVLLARVHELEVEQAAARTPARLTHVAHTLGLAPPQPGQLVGASTTAQLAQAQLGTHF